MYTIFLFIVFGFPKILRILVALRGGGVLYILLILLYLWYNPNKTCCDSPFPCSANCRQNKWK